MEIPVIYSDEQGATPRTLGHYFMASPPWAPRFNVHIPDDDIPDMGRGGFLEPWDPVSMFNAVTRVITLEVGRLSRFFDQDPRDMRRDQSDFEDLVRAQVPNHAEFERDPIRIGITARWAVLMVKPEDYESIFMLSDFEPSDEDEPDHEPGLAQGGRFPDQYSAAIIAKSRSTPGLAERMSKRLKSLRAF